MKGGKSGKDAYDKGKKLGTRVDLEVPDPDTMLSNVNFEAIQEGLEVVKTLSTTSANFNITIVLGHHRQGALDLRQMVDGVALLTKENKVMRDEDLKRYEQLISQCEAAQREAQSSLLKLEDVWKAFDAGGAEALQNERERDLFEKVQAWKAAGDPRVSSLHLAMDQASKSIRFTGTSFRSTPVSPSQSIITQFHRYEENVEQAEQGTLYVRDPAVAKELLAAGLLQAYRSSGRPGAAEKQGDKIGGEKFSISISMCKALMSLGVYHGFVDAEVNLWKDAETWVTRISHRHRGDWYEKDWMNTAEFATFWRSSLGAKYAFVGTNKSGDKPRQIGGATPEEVKRSQTTEATGFANPRKRE